jgi:hypothetical protein
MCYSSGKRYGSEIGVKSYLAFGGGEVWMPAEKNLDCSL